MTKHVPVAVPKPDALFAAADAAGRMIPPVWPLASSVAVNPFLGQTGETLAEGLRVAAERCVAACPTGALAFKDGRRPPGTTQ